MKQEAFLRRIFAGKSISVVANNGGQAVIEYVLLLIVIVSLVLGMRGVFGSMNTFMTDMIGGYVTCLMEYGELPAFGVEESDLKQHKDGDGKRCPVPRFVASTNFGGATGGGTGGGTGSGGPGSGSGGSGNGKNGSNGRNNGKSASKGGSGSDNSSGADDASRGGGGSNSRASARGRSGSSPYSRGQISRGSGFATADNPRDLNEASKVKALEGPGEEDSGWGETSGGRRGNRRSAPARSRYKALVGKMAEEAQKNARTPRKPGSTLLAVDEGFRMTVVKRNFTPPEQKPYVEEKPEEGFQFSSFLKWLIIAGIIIACFVLFGGQVMNYSNSDS